MERINLLPKKFELKTRLPDQPLEALTQTGIDGTIDAGRHGGIKRLSVR